MQQNIVLKTPTELFPVTMNFTNELSIGETISSQITVVKKISDDSIVADIISSEVIATPKVTLTLQNGTLNESYSITTTMTTNNSNVLTLSAIMQVTNTVTGSINKTPTETFLVSVEFSNVLNGDTLSSQTVTSTDITTGLDNTSDFIVGSSIVDSTVVLIKVSDGTLNHDIEVKLQSVTTLGNIFEKIFIVNVRDF